MFKGVLFDWRGTLVHDPAEEWWIVAAHSRLGLEVESSRVRAIVDALAETSGDDAFIQAQRNLDCSAVKHRDGTMLWFRTAGLDDELAVALYELDFEAASHPFYPDVAETLHHLHGLGIAVAVVSDIHFDLRPEFEAAGLAGFIDAYVLSYEHGVQKPDCRVFEIAEELLGLMPADLLMVGDRASRDGGAVAAGITTLLLPPVASEKMSRGLGAVVALVDR